MSESTTAKQGWFHSWTGTPFREAVGWQSPPDPIETRRKQLKSELDEAFKRKDTITRQMEEEGQKSTQYQKQISEYKKLRVQNIVGTQGRLIAKQVDANWGYYGDFDVTDADETDMATFHADREKFKQNQKSAEKNFKASQEKYKDLGAQLKQTQTEINQKTVMLENPVQNGGIVKTS